ncbi:MAG: GHMP kinase [Flavobacteriaceae bacterium]|nr:GHMP kinase [Flavobacteriaceae bacterium]
MNTKVFYSHGKLLLTGEYVVLDGAKALAVPTNKGQYLTVKPIAEQKLVWRSFDENNQIWFENEFLLDDLKTEITENDISKKLLEILLAAQQLNKSFLNDTNGFYVSTKLTFDSGYGLGTSSTLIANIAKWAKVDPYQLLWDSFKGSGYDLACATNIAPLVYQINNELPKIDLVAFNPSFKSQLYFVYLNKKQDSKEGITHYKTLPVLSKEKAISEINRITEEVILCDTLTEFNFLLKKHESIISKLIKTETVQQRLFPEYDKGVVKSLGAWGGDFVLVTVEDKLNLDYFKDRGYTTIFGFEEMLLF